MDIYHIKIICEYLWKDTTQQLLGLHDAKITNTYEIMCMRREGCNWVLRLTRNFYNTGIKVKINQFRNSRICNCGHQKEYNERIDTIRNSIDDYINAKLENNEVFTLDDLKEYMENNGCASQNVRIAAATCMLD